MGVGCEDWPDCYARLNVGLEKKGVTVLTDEAGDVAHYGARVAHRYIASTLGLFIVGIFLYSLRGGKGAATSRLVPAAIFAITVFLSLLGYYTPSRNNPLITMGNLVGGMALLGLLWWLLQREVGAAVTALGDVGGRRSLALVAVCLVTLQIVLGGWSSANYASANCPGLLQCVGSPLADGSVAQVFNPLRDIELDTDGQAVRVDSLGLLSMAHRLFALLTAAYLAWMVRKLRPEAALGGTLVALSVFSLGQIALGVSMILLQLPLVLVTMHNALAAGLLLSCINLLHQLTPARAPRPPG